MSYRVKIKINDFFPKIDAIPYDDFICLISCNNYYSRIKLTEYESQQFKFDLKIIKNTDLLFNVKLINYIDNNKLIGMYNLIIPHNMVNQILQREDSMYKQQIKLIMNSNVKIKLFGIMMNITNIYLDLVFQFSSTKGNLVLNRNHINKMKLYEMLENNSYAKNYGKNKKKNKSSNNNSKSDTKKNNMNINLSKSPNIYYNNYIYDFKENEINRDKKHVNSNIKNFQNISNQKCSDINFNVMNYNYLNYLKIDNNCNDNNYVENVKFKINSRSPIIISKNVVRLNNQENSSKHKKQNQDTTYFGLLNKYKNKVNDFANMDTKGKQFNYMNYQNISTKKKGKNSENQLNISPFLMKNNNINNLNDITDLNYNEIVNYTKDSQHKYLTEAKNSMNLDNIINTIENLDTNKIKSDSKYHNLIKNNSNHKISYINDINKGQNILYDKKNHLNKFINRKKSNKSNQNLIKNAKINKQNEILKTQVFRNKIKFSEFNENQTHGSKINTPKIIKDFNYNLNNNTPIIIDLSTKKKQIKKNRVINNIEENNLAKFNINEEENKNINIKNEVKENNKIKQIENKDNIEIKKEEEEPLLNPEEIKNQIIKSLVEAQNTKKEIISQIIKNREYKEKLLLIQEKFYTELKIRNRLNEETNNMKTKNIIHVNIRGKLNSNPYLSMKTIKSKESSIFYKIFYEHKNSPEYKALEARKKLKEKLEQQKKIHSLLNFVRELIKKYENLSQIYNDDEKKKILFKSLLLRYGIREKEESKENNLMDKFKEIKNKLEEEKNKIKMQVKAKEIQEDLYKNVIKEEEDEERSSISDPQFFQRKSSLRNRLSWCSEDSFNREKENYESNKINNNEEGNNSLLSSGLKRIKESDEDLDKYIEKKGIKESNEKKENEDDKIQNKDKEKDNEISNNEK